MLIIAILIVNAFGFVINPDYAETISVKQYSFIISSGSEKFTSLNLQEAVNQNPLLISALFIVSLMKGVVVFLIFSELIKVVQSIKSLKTFTNNNIQAFKNIGIYLLIIFALGAISLNIGEGDSYRFSFSIKFYPLIGALFALLMAEIFKEGNRLREENELTV